MIQKDKKIEIVVFRIAVELKTWVGVFRILIRGHGFGS